MSVWAGSLPVSATDLDLGGRSTATRGAMKLRRGLLVVLVACLAVGVILHQGIGGARRPAASAAHAGAYHQDGLLSLPAAAQGPVSAALGADSHAYRVTAAGGALRAANPAQHLHVSFTANGISVNSGLARLGLALGALGYGSRLQVLGPSRPRNSANRVSYAPVRGVRAWYENGPLGLEQGFDLATRPGTGRGPLTLSLSLTGDMRARLAARGVVFSGGGVALRYGGLAVSDARGRRLRAWFALARGRVLIRVADRGARYPLRIDPFIQQAELTASDGAAGDYFGYSVAVSGSTIAVGAPGHPDTHGAVHVFNNAGGAWTQTAELTASDGAPNDKFGYSVAVSGSTIAVGAPVHPVQTQQGAAYVFTDTAGGWTQTAELTASDGVPGDLFGISVAVSGSTIAVGAAVRGDSLTGESGVYVFSSTGGAWTQTAELTASDGVPGDEFGYSVSVSGSTIAVGAVGQTVGSNIGQGAVYVFSSAGGAWTQTAELTASDGHALDDFGYSVSVSGTTIAVGAAGHEVGSNIDQGALYVFTDTAGGWTQTAELTASDGASRDAFGYSVAVSGATIAVGQVGFSNTQQGAVYVFSSAAGGWTQTAELTASDGASGDAFGYPVAVSGSTIAVGARTKTVGSNADQGAVYVFGGPTTYTVSGTVTDKVCGGNGCTYPGARGVTILVKGTDSDGNAVSQTAVSAADGSWSVQVPPGSYTAGPTQDGSTFGPPGFKPPSQAVTVSTQNVTGVNFITPTYTVSGTVSKEVCGGSGCTYPADGGVTVLVTGADSDGSAVSETAVSAADGSWSIQVPAGSYTAGPSKDGTTFGPPGFKPPSKAVTVSTQDVTGVNFVAPSYEISGTLTNNNCGCEPSTPTPVPDVAVNVASDDGAGVTTSDTSDNDGDWSVEVPDGGYTVTPDPSSYSWDPASQQVTISGADKDGVDFQTCGANDETTDFGRGGPIAMAAAFFHKCLATTTTLDCRDSSGTVKCYVIVASSDKTDLDDSPVGGTVLVKGELVYFPTDHSKNLGHVTVDFTPCVLGSITGRHGAECIVSLIWPEDFAKLKQTGGVPPGAFSFKDITADFLGSKYTKVGLLNTEITFNPSRGTYDSPLIIDSEEVNLFGAATSAGGDLAQLESQDAAAVDAWAGAAPEATASVVRARRLASPRVAGAAYRDAAATGASLVAASETLLWEALALDSGKPSTHDGAYATVLAAKTPSVRSSLFAGSALGRAERSLVTNMLHASSLGATLAQTLDRLATAQAKRKTAAEQAQQTAASSYLRRLSALVGGLPGAETELARLLQSAGLGSVTVTAADLSAWHGVPAAIQHALASIGAGAVGTQISGYVAALQPGVYDFAGSVDNAQLLTATKSAANVLKTDARAALKPGDRL